MSCHYDNCVAYPNNRRTTFIIGGVVGAVFLIIAGAWVGWFAKRNPVFCTGAAWKQACLRCDFFSAQNELSVLQRNAIEDEVKRQDRGSGTDSTDHSPAPSVSHAVATLGGNALDSKGRFKKTTSADREQARTGEEGEQGLLADDENGEVEVPAVHSRWGGVEEDFADSSSSDRENTDDEGSEEEKEDERRSAGGNSSDQEDVVVDLSESQSEVEQETPKRTKKTRK